MVHRNCSYISGWHQLEETNFLDIYRPSNIATNIDINGIRILSWQYPWVWYKTIMTTVSFLHLIANYKILYNSCSWPVGCVIVRLKVKTTETRLTFSHSSRDCLCGKSHPSLENDNALVSLQYKISLGWNSTVHPVNVATVVITMHSNKATTVRGC